MELIYYCATKIVDVSVANGELISIEKYFNKDVNFKINGLTEEEKTNIELLITELKTELKKYELDENHIRSYIKNIISLYFYTCRFNIDIYIASLMQHPIDYFLWFFNKELSQNTNQENKNQKFIDLMNNINNKIGNLKDKKIFKADNVYPFSHYFSCFDINPIRDSIDINSIDINSIEANLELNFAYWRDVKDVDFREMPCIFLNINDLDIKKIDINKYHDLFLKIQSDRKFKSILSEEATIEHIKNNFIIEDSLPIKEGTSEAASSSNKKKISIGILLFIIVLIGTYFLLNKKHMNIYKTMKKPIKISEI